MHIETEEWPAFAIREPIRNRRYILNERGQISHNLLDNFIQNFLDGKIPPNIKSEPIPDWQGGPVVSVVADTYDEIVLNNDKDVFIEFYTQWCGPCKEMAPALEALAEIYYRENVKDKVTVAKMDAEANDVPYDVIGFPWLQLFPAGSKESPIMYTGSRTMEDMAEFIRENGRHNVDVLSTLMSV